MKRDERVAAVKILSVRRKAVQKFWAPQQGHRPLRRVTRGAGRAESPSHGFAVPAPFRRGGLWGRGTRIATASVRTGFAMTWFFMGCGVGRDTWVPPYSRTFCRAGPACPAVSAVQARPGGQRRPPLRIAWWLVRRADVGIGPYGYIARGAGESGIPQSRLCRASPL